MIYGIVKPVLAESYDVICRLKEDSDFTEACRLIDIGLQLYSQPGMRINCLIREHGPAGDVREAAWRLGADCQITSEIRY